MNLCLIPARGGSKRIPRKNIRLFKGKPMIGWSIEAAQKSNCFDNIIVSTDNPDIADVARSFGADAPFLRPAELSDDYSTTREVVVHGIDALSQIGADYEFVCCLYATAPFVLSSDIDEGLRLLQSSRKGSLVFAATPFSFPIQRAIKLDSMGYSIAFDPPSVSKRSQDLEESFHDAGQFYWAKPSTWKMDMNIFDVGRPLLLPNWRVQDIDTEDDWKRAELMHNALSEVISFG